ncbi:MAG: DUF697 domain-containing protein [Clostridia bacterium]|nr:DUF697 domain-containing protein [Clostridia bacterium]
MESEKQKKTAIQEEREFEDSISSAFRQKNEKRYFTWIVLGVFVLAVLFLGAVADLLTLCFEIHPYLGYGAAALTAILFIAFVVVPVCKVLRSRFFIVDVTSDNFNLAKRKNTRALKDVGTALLEYNTNPKNADFKYLSPENVEKLRSSLKSGDKKQLQETLKKVYATDVAKCTNSLIFKNAGKVFLTTSISQNERIDALSVLLVNMSLIKKIVAVYGYRPSYAKLFRIYTSVLCNSLIAYGMQNVNWFNVFGKFFKGVAQKIPFVDTLVDSAVQGTVSAFLTVLVGLKTKRYLCSDYRKQEKIDVKAENDGIEDDEVRLAASIAQEIRKTNADKIPV